MKTQLLSSWVIVAIAITALSWNSMVNGGTSVDCYKSEQGNPIVTPCDDCYQNGAKWEICDDPFGNPIQTRCTLPTTQNGVQCDENANDCWGDKIEYNSAYDCANDINGNRIGAGCVNNPTISWIEATWQDLGDTPICDGHGGP